MERARIEAREVMQNEVELIKETAILDDVYFRRGKELLLDVLHIMLLQSSREVK